jgi:hypothetical protein
VKVTNNSRLTKLVVNRKGRDNCAAIETVVCDGNCENKDYDSIPLCKDEKLEILGYGDLDSNNWCKLKYLLEIPCQLTGAQPPPWVGTGAYESAIGTPLLGVRIASIASK